MLERVRCISPRYPGRGGGRPHTRSDPVPIHSRDAKPEHIEYPHNLTSCEATPNVFRPT